MGGWVKTGTSAAAWWSISSASGLRVLARICPSQIVLSLTLGEVCVLVDAPLLHHV